MAYVPFHADWHDLPATDTPITAVALEYIEAGIASAAAAADAAVPKALVDAKGDLLVGSAADTVSRLAVGADDTVPAAAAGQATGIQWKKIDNAMVASNAAISASKLAGYPADAQQFLRGDGSWGGGTWQSYAPVWGGGPTLGNGSLDGRYVQIGKVVHAHVRLVMGSTTTFVGTAWTFTLPVAASTSMGTLIGIGSASILDVTPFTLYVAIVRLNSTTEVQLDIGATPSNQVQQTVPFTYAVNDAIRFSFTYEAA